MAVLKDKEHLFSVTLKDCRVDRYRGSGKGGQKRNKTSSSVRITHIASGAVGQSDKTRKQPLNTRDAFLKMIETPKFQAWLKVEIARKTGVLHEIEERVDSMMQPGNIKEEVFKDGRWQE